MITAKELIQTQIIEISSKKSNGIKRPIKMVLHEIMSDSDVYQDNGISWSEEYTLNALSTLEGAPIAVEYWNKDTNGSDVEIGGHGLLDEVEDSDGNKIPIFESEVVGSFKRGYIDTIQINNSMKKCLIGEGYIYEQRAKGLTDWLMENVPSGKVKGSVEIVGKPENQNKIVYKDNKLGAGRVPMIYDYSGHCILSSLVKPADESAIVLEISQKKENKGEQPMDEKVLNTFVSDIKSIIIETNTKNAEADAKIAELNVKMAEKDKEIEDKKKTIDELNAKCKTFEKEASDKDESMKAKESELNELNEKHKKLQKKEKISEMNAVLIEYSDKEKEFAKAEISAFEADPFSVEINSITDKICRELVRKVKENAKSKTTELNFNQSNDIFASVMENNPDKNDSDSIY